MSLISEHVAECAERTTHHRRSEFEDEEFLFGLKKLRREDPDKLPCALIQAFLDGHPELADKLNSYDIQSLVALVGAPVRNMAYTSRYGKATNFVRMDMWLDSQHIITIGSDEMLEYSRRVDWLMFDGTFKCVPKPFYQMVTVMGCSIETRKFVPVIHFLLTGKMQANYRAMFEILDTQTTFDYVNRITADFEKGLQNEIQFWISRNQMETTFHGCRFHFVQALHKRMKKMYGRAIDRDVKMKTLLRLITWFPFLPRPVVENLVMELQCRDTPIEKFLRYFVRFWLPKYDEWALTADGEIRRTNNALESYHSILAERMSKHPSMSRFLTNLSLIDAERIRDAVNVSKAPEDTAPLCDEIIYQFQESLVWFPMKGATSRKRRSK